MTLLDGKKKSRNLNIMQEILGQKGLYLYILFPALFFDYVRKEPKGTERRFFIHQFSCYS